MASVQVETTPTIPLRRRRPSIDIIDIDSLDDDDIRASQAQLQRRRLEREQRRARTSSIDVITISDSEDDIAVASSSQATSTRREHRPRPRHHSRYLSPPAPQLAGGYVPPVPPLPPQFANFHSLPARRHPNSFTIPAPTVVRPNELPFEFERAITDNNRAERRQSYPVAAPASHHLPSMGLGGALIASNRRDVEEQAARARQRRNVVEEGFRLFNYPSLSQAAAHLSNSFRRLSRGRNAESDQAEAMAWLFEGELDQTFQNTLDFATSMADMDMRRQSNSAPEYSPSFTHQGKPPPGFTFDFAPSSSGSPESGPVAGSSTSAHEDSSTLLVCGKCLDPLATSGGSVDAAQKLWGLRCGHLLDGKCVDQIMAPSPVEAPPTDVQGADPMNPAADDDHSLDGLPYRSKLRARNSNGSSRQQPAPHPSKAHRQKNGKGKAKAEEPVEGKSHEWTCPISGCNRPHLSVFVDGKWVMDKERGAIGIFV